MSLSLAGYVFNPIVSIADYVKNPDIEGLFGIFFLKHPEKKMADYGVVYIGETKEIYEDNAFPTGHKKYHCWADKGQGEENLYIGLCPTPGLMPKQKDLIRNHLIYKYNPPCNR
jgi:hypothetical protein